VTVPPCRRCGAVPIQYARFANDTVQCLGYCEEVETAERTRTA